MTDFDKLRDAVVAKCPHANCPFCGGSEWDHGPDRVAVIPAKPAEPGTAWTGEGFPVFSIACSRCGFVRNHSIAILES